MRYGSYDERGVPLTDADGAELAKSAAKKLEKVYAAHVKKWERATPEEKAPAPAQAPGDALWLFEGAGGSS